MPTVKSNTPPVFILPQTLPVGTGAGGKVYGLEIKKSVETALNLDEYEADNNIECVQRSNGVFKIFLKGTRLRHKLLISGLSIRGHDIPIYGENPLAIDGQEAVKLKISNIDYLTPDSAVITALRKLKIQLVTDIMYECYRDNEGNLLKTKNGSRFIFIVRPTTFFAQTVSIGEETAYSSYKGMEKDMEIC